MTFYEFEIKLRLHWKLIREVSLRDNQVLKIRRKKNFTNADSKLRSSRTLHTVGRIAQSV